MTSSMLSVRKFLLSKLRSSCRKEGQHGKDNRNTNSSRVRTVINEEYREAFRTKSYTEIQGQMETREDAKSCSHIHLSEYLVEPRQDTLETSTFVTSYFDISLEAGRICEFLLQNVHQVRLEYLASSSLHSNPFSTMKFHELHDTHKHLLHELKSKCVKTKKKKKLIKRGLAVMGCGALLLLLAVHSTVGLLALPGLIMSLVLLLVKKKLKRAGKERVEDAAAKGVYVLIKDFDMMSRLVQRLGDEMEHKKFKAEFCVKKQVKLHDFRFLELLEELENQIYLCFLDINRSRRLLIQELDN